MCTVTYVPTAGGYLFASNRDESPKRAAPIAVTTYPSGLTYPKDPVGGGTWLAMNAARTLCLLNGAFVLHERHPPYAKSRGLIVLDYFDYDTPEQFEQAYSLEGVEPFTLVDCRAGVLHTLRWDEQLLHISTHDPAQPRIWSSATLYDQAQQAQKEADFQRWLAEHPAPDAESLWQFQRTQLLEREMVRTVSTSLIAENHGHKTFSYERQGEPRQALAL